MDSRILSIVACSGFALPLTGQEAPMKLDLNDPNLEIVEDSVIPIPLEIFASLDKLGPQKWSDQITSRNFRVDTNRSRTAMLFGLVVSEGFIAVQAKDKESVRRVGRDVLALAAPLGVSESVEGHANAIVDGAANGDWEQVRHELDKTRQTVINKMMKELRSADLVPLVSLGGWLGGTDALAAVLRENYTAEGSDLLNQPDLIKKLKADFNGLPTRSKRGSLFTHVSDTLAELEVLMQTDELGEISKVKVIEISQATKNLVEAIYES